MYKQKKAKRIQGQDADQLSRYIRYVFVCVHM